MQRHGIRHLPQSCILEFHAWNTDNELRMVQMSAVDSLKCVKPKPLLLQTGGPQPPQTNPATERQTGDSSASHR